MVAVAIGGAAVLGAGASVIAGSKAANATENAANTAAAASEAGTQAQVAEAQREYDLTRSDYAPYRDAGTGALGALQSLYGLPATTGIGAPGTANNDGVAWGTGQDSGAYQTIANKAPANVDWGAYVKGNPDALAQWNAQTPDLASFNGDIAKFGEFHYENDGSRRDLTPYQSTSTGGVAGAAGATGTDPTSIIEATPGYQFRLQQGINAVKANASAKGNLGSTATQKNIEQFADGTASDEYNQYANRLASLAGVGQTATGSTTAAGTAASSTIAGAYGANAVNQGNAATAAGNARSSAYQNIGSSVNNGATNLASLYLYQQNGGFGGSGTGAYGISGSDGIY